MRILELVDSPWIRVNYDSGNTYLSGEDPYAMLEAVIDKVVHVHAKDISVKQAEAERGKVTGTAVGCACGDGEIDWNRVVRRLRKAGYKGVLSVECGSEEEAKRSLAHLTKVLQQESAEQATRGREQAKIEYEPVRPVFLARQLAAHRAGAALRW